MNTLYPDLCPRCQADRNVVGEKMLSDSRSERTEAWVIMENCPSCRTYFVEKYQIGFPSVRLSEKLRGGEK